MDSMYMQSVVAEFVGQLVDISKQKQRSYAFSNKIADFGDIFIDYLASEVVNRGYFYYNSNKKYAECDENEKEWAVALNQMAIDVFGESIDEMIRPNTHILLSVNKDNATIYYNDGTFSPAYADKKIEVKKSHNKNDEEITK